MSAVAVKWPQNPETRPLCKAAQYFAKIRLKWSAEGNEPIGGCTHGKLIMNELIHYQYNSEQPSK